MITITNKIDCCGCSACEQSCPQSCISMQQDTQGFNYPVVDGDKCIDCHLCEKVCPVINQYEPKEAPLTCYLSKTTDEKIRAKSSSGGIFTEISKYVINQGGVVFGVRFNEKWLAEYDYTEAEDGLDAFRGSKYIQADVRGAFRKAQEFLKRGRLVLFSGTPCYIAGLNHYLKKSYPNLITLDIVCHSIPSPRVWSLYIDELKKKNKSKIKELSFRNKRNGWTKYSIGILFSKNGQDTLFVEDHFCNIFSKGFAEDLFTRPSCSACPARNFKSHSDITIADAWDINKYHPEKNDEKGISHVLINTQQGFDVYASCVSNLDSMEINYTEVEPKTMHLPITKSCKSHEYRKFFFYMINNGQSVIFSTQLLLGISRLKRQIKSGVWYFIQKIRVI